MLDCKRETANALPSLCIVGVEFIPIKLLVLLDRNSNEERTSIYRYFGVLLASFAASMSILTERNVSTVGEFGAYIL